MATGTLRPTGTVSHTWSQGTGHANIDDVVTQPAAGDGSIIKATQPAGDDNDVEVVSFGTISVGSVSNITVWTYGGYAGGAGTPEVDVYMGAWQGYQEVSFTGAPFVWTSDSFNGSWTQANLDGLQVRYRADVPDAGKAEETNSIDVCYVVVTYVSPGYGHDFLGVPAANIDEVSGVPTANIDNIKGV